LLTDRSHGLSYTTFDITPKSVSRESVTADVENTGSVDGTETIQVFVHGKTSAIRRPKRELHGFAKVFLKAGETKKVRVEIDKYAASLWDEAEDRWMFEKGEYEVLVGTSSREQDLVSAGTFTIEETSWWLGL
jgi:beta-glucosidase